MGHFRHNRPSPNEVETFRFTNPAPNTCSEQKSARQAAKANRSHWNRERREKRAKEKAGDMKAKVGDMETVVQVTLDENELLHKKLDESTRLVSKLKREVKLLAAKFNSRVRREPQKIATSVQRALSTASTAQQIVHYVKTPDGIIQDWARNVILHLVCASGVPAANTWATFSCVATGLGIVVVGSWSARSAGRVVLEGALAAEEMIVEDFGEALGNFPTT